MKRLTFALSTALLPFVCTAACAGQMEHGAAPMAHEGMGGMKHEAGVPSKTLTLTGLNGATMTLTAEDLKAMPHVTVTVTNGHSHNQETYSGVAIKDLLAVVTRSAEGQPAVAPAKSSPRMIVVIAGATDHFHVALTLCDTDPGCRNGQAIVADAEDGKPLAADGAFKLILTEDKMPGRWVRNLDSLTEKNLGDMQLH